MGRLRPPGRACHVGPREGCDDGNEIDDDECTNACALPTCGDGIVNGDETCDDANDDDTDDCPMTCQSAMCGDGFVHAGFEDCDDGHDEAGDFCTTAVVVPTLRAVAAGRRTTVTSPTGQPSGLPAQATAWQRSRPARRSADVARVEQCACTTRARDTDRTGDRVHLGVAVLRDWRRRVRASIGGRMPHLVGVHGPVL